MASAVFLLFLMYPSVVKHLFNVFRCHDPVEGVAYLKSDLRVACFEGGHTGAAVAAGLVMLVYAIGMSSCHTIF